MELGAVREARRQRAEQEGEAEGSDSDADDAEEWEEQDEEMEEEDEDPNKKLVTRTRQEILSAWCCILFKVEHVQGGGV